MFKKILSIFTFGNITILITLLIAVLFVMGVDFVSIFGITYDKIIVAIFSLVAIEMFISRITFEKDINKGIQEIIKTINKKETSVLKKASDLERLEAIIEKADSEIWILGINLQAVGKIYNSVEEALKRGCKVKLLATDPYGKALPIASQMSGIKCDIRKSTIISSLSDLMMMFEKRIRENKLEIHVIDSVLPVGIVGLDGNSKSGMLVIQHYLYKKRASYSPNIVINIENKYWYELYKEQWEEMWKDSTDFSLKEIMVYEKNN